ncbi:sulfite exporter TauE/SafE family protein [Roseomonas eburnea]|uniref:Probable membrane transporter protein n=1 Tax=Neoroseomonas eburnea TaxID=1346889 RepID=A0A9X9XIQ5_9PROT|nr:sulfite exporter TauE/SafE family protein [Neoroseomonas eburnea]MBR0683591.1 sulfite exporter TauE/SafE family protein [Neoroseomonas eburnea]
MDDLLLFVVVGFAAQMVDGAIGMAYGVTATSVLMSMGIPPAVASASVHAAEVVTTGASGFAHWRVGNVSLHLMARLAIPGVCGGVLGAYVLTDLPVAYVRPVVAAWLIAMGGLILFRALRPPSEDRTPHNPTLLGFGGGFLDAIGGGGWGPVVASTLIGRGNVPRLAIGSTNAAEFFVTFSVTITFFATIGLELWPVILGLVLGGCLAAPFAALITRKLPDRPLMIIVAVVIMLLSLRNMLISLGLE